MAKPRYAIPFNGDSRLLEEALRSGQVSEVYFAGPSESNQSHCPDLKGADRKTLGRMIALCRAHRARVNLLCNAWTLFFRDLEAGFKFIRSVPGIDAVTLADPLAISTFREELPDTEIQASIIMNLNSYEKLETALKAGIGTATLPLRFNRDADFLVRVRGLKERYPRFKIKLIANHHCKSECLFGPWHYMLGEADVFDKDLFLKKSSLNKKIYGPVIFCLESCASPSGLIRLPFIRPEDIGYYVKNGYADVFKLVNRSWPSDILKKVFRAYFTRRHRGDLFDIINAEKYGVSTSCDNAGFPAGFAERVLTCDKTCESCSYCENVAKRLIRERDTSLPPQDWD